MEFVKSCEITVAESNADLGLLIRQTFYFSPNVQTSQFVIFIHTFSESVTGLKQWVTNSDCQLPTDENRQQIGLIYKHCRVALSFSRTLAGRVSWVTLTYWLGFARLTQLSRFHHITLTRAKKVQINQERSISPAQVNRGLTKFDRDFNQRGKQSPLKEKAEQAHPSQSTGGAPENPRYPLHPIPPPMHPGREEPVHSNQSLFDTSDRRPRYIKPNGQFSVCLSQLRSCMKVEVAILGSQSLISLMVSVDVRQQWDGGGKINVWHPARKICKSGLSIL